MMWQEVENFFDIRNQLMHNIDVQAKAKNTEFVPSIPTTPQSGQHSGPLIN